MEAIISIKSQADIRLLNSIADRTANDSELVALINLYTTYGSEALHDAIHKPLITDGNMRQLIGKEVYTTIGWVTVLTAKPIANANGWACTFSDSPDLVYVVNKNGSCNVKPIYMLRDKPKSESKSKPKADLTLTEFN